LAAREAGASAAVREAATAAVREAATGVALAVARAQSQGCLGGLKVVESMED
jgi:hypothetical protein